MKIFIVFIATVLFFSCSENNLTHESLTFELRLADTEYSPELAEMDLYNSEQKFYVHKSIVLKNEDLASAEIIDWQTHPKILVTLTAKGREKFADFTLENIGKTAAMIVDNKLMSAPRINAQISNGKLIIAGFFNHDETQAISEGIIIKS